MDTILYIMELTQYNNYKKYEKYFDILSHERQNQINSFKFERDKKLSLLSGLLVRCIVCNHLSLDNADLVFEKDIYGKPFLVNDLNFHFNISHTNDAIAIGVSNYNIGVDIEKIEDCKAVHIDIAKRFFHNGEFNYIFSNNMRTSRTFYEIWTKKEAYIKWDGKGLSIPLNSFNVLDEEKCRMLVTKVFNDYMVSVCSFVSKERIIYKLIHEKYFNVLLEKI